MLNASLKPHRAAVEAGAAGEQKIFAMLEVIPPAGDARRPPLAFVLAIDSSGSMRGYADQRRAREEVERFGRHWRPDHDDQLTLRGLKLPLPTKTDVAIEAARALIEDPRLQADDRVAVCCFNDETSVLHPLAPLGDRRAALAALEGLRDCRGETRLARSLACARRELEALPERFARRVVLLTDGRALDEAECRREAEQLARAAAPLVAAGVGARYNDALLVDLANATAGRCYHLAAPAVPEEGAGSDGAAAPRDAGALGQLHRVLDEELQLAAREAVTGLVADIFTAPGVRLDSITRVYPSMADVPLNRPPYRLGNIARDDYTVFLLEFTVSAAERPEGAAEIAQVILAGHLLLEGRDEELPPQPLSVRFTADDAALAERDEEVRGYIDQRTIDREVRRALREADRNPREARLVLQAVAEMADGVGNHRMARFARAALDELTHDGTLSPESRKTIALGPRTRTLRSEQARSLEGVPAAILQQARGGEQRVIVCRTCRWEAEGDDRDCRRCGLPLRAELPAALAPGATLAGDRFLIEQPLGRGGHGITYRCFDRERGCPVAIKELFLTGCSRRGPTVEPPPGAARGYAQAREAFRREARVLHRLEHPSIVRVHLDFEENNTAYLVMELVQGTDLLEHMVQRGRLPERLAREYIEKVGNALGQVHRAGLLHLDVKPENIIAGPDRRVVLIDFDAAREMREFAGGRMLTPGYAPLEQYIEDAPLGPAADVYGLAATLYHLLAGEAPVPAPDRARGVALRPPRAFNPGMSEAVEQAVQRGLALLGRDRPQRVGDFLAALDEGTAAPRGQQLGEHAGRVHAIAFTPDGWRLASAGDDRRVRLWTLATGQQETLGDGAQEAGKIVLTSLPTVYQPAPRVTSRPGVLLTIALSADGRLLAGAGEDVRIWLWDMRTRRDPRALVGHEGTATAVAFSPRGALLASGGAGGAVRLWDLDRNLRSQLLGAHQRSVTRVAFSPTPERRGAARSALAALTAGYLRASGNGASPSWLLASASEDGQVLLWEPGVSGALRLEGHAGAVRGLAFDPAGRVLASGGKDGTVRLWDVARGRELRRLQGCREGVTCVAFSPDGTTLAAGGEDFTVRLWHLASGWEDLRLNGHTGRLSAVAFSPDGTLLATGSWDQTVRLWELG